MAVDRLSVTIPDVLGAALRALAERRGETVSTVVTEAIAHRLRLEALDLALAEADQRYGAVPEPLIAAAEAELLAAHAPRRTPRTQKTRRAKPIRPAAKPQRPAAQSRRLAASPARPTAKPAQP